MMVSVLIYLNYWHFLELELTNRVDTAWGHF